MVMGTGVEAPSVTFVGTSSCHTAKTWCSSHEGTWCSYEVFPRGNHAKIKVLYKAEEISVPRELRIPQEWEGLPEDWAARRLAGHAEELG